MSLYLVLMLLYSVINSLYSVLIPLYSVLMSFYWLKNSVYGAISRSFTWILETTAPSLEFRYYKIVEIKIGGKNPSEYTKTIFRMSTLLDMK